MNYDEILAEMKKTHEKKAHDYSKDNNPFSNFEFAELISKGFEGIDRVFATIIGIKIARLIELQWKEPTNESRIDTFRDLTIYCSLWWQYHAEPHNHRSYKLDYTEFKSVCPDGTPVTIRVDEEGMASFIYSTTSAPCPTTPTDVHQADVPVSPTLKAIDEATRAAAEAIVQRFETDRKVWIKGDNPAYLKQIEKLGDS